MRYLILALPLLLVACHKPAETPPAPAAVAAPVVADDGWNGKYEGDLRVEVTGTQGAHKVSLLTATQDCTGDIGLSDGGIAAQDASPDELRMALEEDDVPAICHVTLKRTGNILSVSEQDCGYYHGATCSFNGTVTRVK